MNKNTSYDTHSYMIYTSSQAQIVVTKLEVNVIETYGTCQHF